MSHSSQSNNLIIVYIAYPNQRVAQRVTESLLKKKLIACANYFSVASSYRWKEKIGNTKEVVSILKTKHTNWAKVKKAVESMHSYDIPCIMKIEGEFNKAFADWIEKETK